MCGACVIIRNDKGEIVVARTIPLQDVTTPRHFEILVISCGIQLPLKLGFFQLELELDAQKVVQAILYGKENLAIDGHLLDRVKTMLQQFSMVSCSYVCHECNQVAHELATFAAKHQVFCAWEENFPSFGFSFPD